MFSNVTGFNLHRRRVAAKDCAAKAEEVALAEKRRRDAERKRIERKEGGRKTGIGGEAP